MVYVVRVRRFVILPVCISRQVQTKPLFSRFFCMRVTPVGEGERAHQPFIDRGHPCE